MPKSLPTLSDEALRRWQSFDLLASMIWVTRYDGQIAFVNAVVQELLGVPRHALQGQQLRELIEQPAEWDAAILGARQGEFAALRCEATLKAGSDPVEVHMVIAPVEGEDLILVEMLPTEQQSRQEREGRLMEQALANKELIRNLAHEIKNPLGGIRGAAQLLQMEVESKDLIEFTQVIIREADRLQTLVDRSRIPQPRPD